MKLYHTGFSEIRRPDISRGRRNADFGPGFYTSPDRSFSCRWARERRGEKTYLNTYELDTEGLNILALERNEEWFDYVYANRRGSDRFGDAYDVIAGPIANDTIYDTFGIITSGFLKKEEALKLLLIGPAYTQTVIKTEKASLRLKWISAEIIPPEMIAEYRRAVAEEEKEYQKQLSGILDEFV